MELDQHDGVAAIAAEDRNDERKKDEDVSHKMDFGVYSYGETAHRITPQEVPQSEPYSFLFVTVDDRPRWK